MIIKVQIVLFSFRSGGEQAEKGRKDKRKGHEAKQRRKGGYCECCVVKYDSLKVVSLQLYIFGMFSKRAWHQFELIVNLILQHLQSEQHQVFSKSDEYLVVDRVISGLSCNFLQISPQIER